MQELAPYAGRDAEDTLELYNQYKNSWVPSSEIYRVNLEMLPVLADMERRGMYMSPAAHDLAVYLRGVIRGLEDQWYWEWPSVKISSPDQLRAFYHEGVWLEPPCKTPTGMFKVDEEALEYQLANLPDGSRGYQAARLKLEWQGHHKLLSTYTTKLLDAQTYYSDGRLHPSFNLCVTATGRLSCGKPNLQNIPTRTELGKRIRQAFLPAPGHVYVSADYSQIELRVLAHLAGEGKLAQAYREGRDIHQQTADYLGVSRDDAKTWNFAEVYGAGVDRLAKTTKSTKEAAEDAKWKYREAYPEVLKLKKRVLAVARERGYIKTFLGHRRYFEHLNGRRGAERWAEERRAFNLPIQGSASDIVKLGMVRAYKAGLPMVCQIHDDIMLEVREKEAKDAAQTLKECLEGAYKLSVPLKVDPKIGRNWGECK